MVSFLCQFLYTAIDFNLPVAYGLLTGNYLHTTIDFICRNKKNGLGLKRMTKSWYILQKSILFLCCRGHHSTFSFHHFIIWDFYLIIYLGQKMKVRFSYNILISLYAQCLIHNLAIYTSVYYIPNV